MTSAVKQNTRAKTIETFHRGSGPTETTSNDCPAHLPRGSNRGAGLAVATTPAQYAQGHLLLQCCAHFPYAEIAWADNPVWVPLRLWARVWAAAATGAPHLCATAWWALRSAMLFS